MFFCFSNRLPGDDVAAVIVREFCLALIGVASAAAAGTEHVQLIAGETVARTSQLRSRLPARAGSPGSATVGIWDPRGMFRVRWAPPSTIGAEPDLA